MQIKAIYSKLVNKYLQKYGTIRIKFSGKGKVVRVEKRENGKWIFDEAVTKEFSEFSMKIISITNEMTLTLKK